MRTLEEIRVLVLDGVVRYNDTAVPAKRLSDQVHEECPGNELRMAARTRDVYAHGR